MRRWWKGLMCGAAATVVVALAPGASALAADSVPAAPAASTVTAERPAGAVVIDGFSFDAKGKLVLDVIDTRDDDPGWVVRVAITGATQEVRWRPHVPRATAAFVDSEGDRYEQQVTASHAQRLDGDVTTAALASSPAGHGLGVAHITGTLRTEGHGASAPLRITVTVI